MSVYNGKYRKGLLCIQCLKLLVLPWFALVIYDNHSNYFHCLNCVEAKYYIILTVTYQHRTRNLKYGGIVLALAHGT